MKILSAAQLKGICEGILRAVGTPEDEAEIVSDTLVKANLRGIDSHGVIRLPVYLSRVKHKTIIPGAPFKTVRESPSSAVVDGGSGFGQVIAVKAMKLAIEKAERTGLGAVSAFNTNHFGMAAYYALLALQSDMISMIISNAGPYVVPWGGRIPMLGTNPICVGIPSGQSFPIILDMATSATARSRIEKIAKEGGSIPEGWAIDESGKPTTDPMAALRGALLPFGGVKGYGLSLIIDLISGALAGAACGKHVVSLYPEDRKCNVGQFFLAINVDAFTPIEEFKERVDEAVREIKSCPTAPGHSEILIPGEIEHRAEQKRLREGIPIGDNVWKVIERMCEEANIGVEV